LASSIRGRFSQAGVRCLLARSVVCALCGE
jgi:hypothetical protein